MNAARNTAAENRPFGSLLASLAKAHAVDVFLLVECALSNTQLLGEFESEPAYYLVPGPPRLRVITRFSPTFVDPVILPIPNDRIGLWHLKLPLQHSMILALIHGLDRRNNDSTKRELFMSQVTSHVAWAEAQLGHTRSMVAGDFNANPFESELGSTSGMHAVMTPALATSDPRNLMGKSYPFFYNPMWTLYGNTDSGRPPGTFFFNGGQPHEWYWHMLDQVVVRPSLKHRFSPSTLTILTSSPAGPLATRNGRPNSTLASDHFPILFDVELRAASEE